MKNFFTQSTLYLLFTIKLSVHIEHPSTSIMIILHIRCSSKKMTESIPAHCLNTIQIYTLLSSREVIFLSAVLNRNLVILIDNNTSSVITVKRTRRSNAFFFYKSFNTQFEYKSPLILYYFHK